MSLSEFQHVFGDVTYGDISHLIGGEDCDGPGYFRKEIIAHYAPKPKHTPCTTQYGIGAVVMPKTGGPRRVYLGYFEQLDVFVDGQLRDTYTGHLYCSRTDAGCLRNLARDAVWYPRTFQKGIVKTKKPVTVGQISYIPDPLEGQTENDLTFQVPGIRDTQCVSFRFKRTI